MPFQDAVAAALSKTVMLMSFSPSQESRKLMELADKYNRRQVRVRGTACVTCFPHLRSPRTQRPAPVAVPHTAALLQLALLAPRPRFTSHLPPQL